MLAVPALGRRPGERVATESGERDSVYMSHVGGAGVRRVATEICGVRDGVDKRYVCGAHGSDVTAGGGYARGYPANRMGGGLGAGGGVQGWRRV
jgi:hypothetical protein